MKSDQELYKRLRELPKEELWEIEVPRFNAAAPRERMEGVAVIRAVGMIFSRFGTEEEKGAVREWLIALLRDPQEKIRRYALAALPKIGVNTEAEAEMLALLKNGEEREMRHLGRALEKVGGEATLAVIESGVSLPSLTVQKVKAGISRSENEGSVRLEVKLPVTPDLRVLLRCRRGLEDFVREEAREVLSEKEWIIEPKKTHDFGCVVLKPLKEFSLGTLYQMRCFATVAFPLGLIEEGEHWIEQLARCIASQGAQSLMLTATEGTARYRLDFVAKGHQRGAIRQVIERAFALCPEILNDARQAPWSVDILPSSHGKSSVELRPRLYPDPRLGYRQDDIAAASHPPLAACMARLAAKTGSGNSEIIWDPFCGSGLELIERGLLGGVSALYGTDLDPKAIEVAQANFTTAQLDGVHSEFICADFREASIHPGSISLIITNPPLGRRVRIKDMQGLFSDLYTAATRVLKPSGRLVFVNPLLTGPSDPSLKLEYQKSIDLGGFTCRLEMYRKIEQSKPIKKPVLSKPETLSAKTTPAPAWWSRVGRAARLQ